MAIKFLSGLNLSNVTAGSILKLDSNGNIVAATAGTDYATSNLWTTTNNGIYYSDDVRIGTYSTSVAPSAKLHVFDYQTTDPKLLIEDGNTGDASMEFKISTQSYTMGIDNSDSDKFVLAASTALGTTNVLEISTTGAPAFQGDLLVNGKYYLSNLWNISAEGASYAKFSNWVRVSNTGFYTTEDINMDLDDSSSRFVIRGLNNTEQFIADTGTSKVSIPNWPLEANDITQTTSGDNWSSTTSVEYNQTGIKLSRSGSGYVSAAPYKLIGSFTASVSFKTSDTTHLGIIFAASQSSQDNDNYAVILRNNGTDGTEVRVQKRVSSAQTYPISAVNVTSDCDDGNWHELTVSYNGKHIVVDIDGTNYFNQAWTDTSFTSPGLVGLAIYDGTCQFNEFQVTETPSTTTFEKLQLTSSEPQLVIKNPVSGTGNAVLKFEEGSGSTQNATITYNQGGQNNLTIATGYQSATDENLIHLAPAGNIGLTVRGGTGSNNGNVGIGTTLPTQELEVVGTIQATSTGTATLILRGDSGNVGDTGELDSTIKMLHDDGNHGILLETRNYAGANTFEIKSLAASTETSRFLIDQDGTLKIPAYGAGFLTTDANGDVSVDTTSYVDVTGDTMTGDLTIQRGHGDLTFLTLKQEDTSGDLVVQKSFIDFTFVDGNTNETPQVRIGAEVGNNDGSASSLSEEGMGAFVVYTNNADTDAGAAGASLAERLRVDRQGYVGINDTTPSHHLDVNGVIRGQGSIRVDTSATGNPYFGLYQNATEKAYIQYVDGTTDNLMIQSDGKVTLRGDVQYDQDSTNAVISFAQSSLELGKFDQDGYLYSTGFKTTTASTGFLKADGSVDTTSYQAAGSYLTSISSSDVTTALGYRPMSGAYGSWSSITNGNSLDWFPLFTMDDEGDGSALVIFKTYAHDSVTFAVSRGYSGSNSNSINVLNSVHTANSGYATVQALRVRNNGVVEAQLVWSSGPSVQASIHVMTGDDNEVAIETDLEATQQTATVNHTVNVNVRGLLHGYEISSTGDITTGNKLYISTADANTTSTSALVLNGTEVEKRTLGSAAFNADTDFVSASGDTITGTLKLDSELQFLRGSADYSDYIRASNYPSEGYTSGSAKYWLEYGAKGGHHFILNTDGGDGASENSYDDFTIWQGAVDGDRLFEVTNVGNVNITGSLSATGYNNTNWDTAYGWGDHAGLYAAASHTHDYLPLTGGTVTGMTIFEDGMRIGTGSHNTTGRASITFGEGTNTSDSMYIEYDGENLGGDNNGIFIGSNKSGVGDIFRVNYGGQVYSSNYITTANRSANSVLHWSQSGSTTGAIKIQLPGTHGGNWSMLILRISVYEYNSTNHTIFHVSGHDWTSGWYNNGVTKLGDSNKNISLGYDDSYDYVIVGATDSSWSYGHVTIDVVAHPSFYSGNMDITKGWSISKVTSLEGITTQNVTNRKVLTTSDEGSGNGIDADTVDGLQASSFLRSDANDTASGIVTFTNNAAEPFAPIHITGGGNHTGLYINPAASKQAHVRFATNGTLKWQIRAPFQDGADTALKFYSWVNSADKFVFNHDGSASFNNGTVWTSANDGAASGLDADTVDGKHASEFLTVTNFINRNYSLPSGGGTISWNATTRTLSGTSRYIWIPVGDAGGEHINLETSTTDDSWSITGIDDWEIVYYRASDSDFTEGSRISIQPSDLNVVGYTGYTPDINDLVICFKNGDDDKIYMADGRVIASGETSENPNGLATESYVTTQISNLVDSAPAALDTLNELAAALGDDSSFSTTMSTALGNRLRIDVNNQSLTGTEKSNGRTNLGLGSAATSASTDFVAVNGDEMTGNLGIQTTNPSFPLEVGINNANKVQKIGYDGHYIYKLTTQQDQTLTLTCPSYYQAEVIITAHQTNGGAYNNLYIRGIWSNNHTSHHWDEIENIGGLTGSSFSITNGQNDVENSGKLAIAHDYTDGSFAQLVVRVIEHYGTHSSSIS